MTHIALAEDSNEHFITSTTKAMFKALDINGESYVSSQFLIGFLERTGLLRDDIRLKCFYNYLE
jgi:hypothetical protein